MVECPTLDFSSVCDLRVVASSSMSGSALSGESAWDSPSPVPLPTLSNKSVSLFLFLSVMSGLKNCKEFRELKAEDLT